MIYTARKPALVLILDKEDQRSYAENTAYAVTRLMVEHESTQDPALKAELKRTISVLSSLASALRDD